MRVDPRQPRHEPDCAHQESLEGCSGLGTVVVFLYTPRKKWIGSHCMGTSFSFLLSILYCFVLSFEESMRLKEM
ncbi:hypothetical protein JHK84_037671 [Glycine max]|nr:hypothetical protein JHK84_037671 [Glycine max]